MVNETETSTVSTSGSGKKLSWGV